MTKRILHVVTNVGHYDDPDHPTGLWLSELTHAWHVFEQHGFEQTLVSPAGGAVPLEPRALKFPNYDKTAKAWRADRSPAGNRSCRSGCPKASVSDGSGNDTQSAGNAVRGPPILGSGAGTGNARQAREYGVNTV